MNKTKLFEEKGLNLWTKRYWNLIQRNIGFITFEEQEKLRNTKIAVFGVGGLGGPLAEQLVRAGCENIAICDNEKFEESNLNRQICTREDIGEYKVDVVKDFLKKINPDIVINSYYNCIKNNILKILNNVEIVALTLDDPITSILISRECCKKKIPILESWAFPYICAWWFTEATIDYETFYGFNTHNMSIQQIRESESVLLNIKEALLAKILQFPYLKEICNREPGALEGMISGNIALRSFPPMVRMTASYLSFEIIFTGILKIKKMILVPHMIGYDYFRMKPLEFNFLDGNKNSIDN